MTGNYPNLFFKPSALKSMGNSSASVNWQAGLQYKFSENANIFANYSNGRRPKVLQYTSAGDPEVLKAEKVDNFDAGVKASVAGKMFIDITGFYQKYNNFQTRAWIADPGTGEFNYKSIDAGKATSYGLEASCRATLLKGVDLYGNYAFLHAVFDNTDGNGSKQEYAGNTFRLSPKNSFTLGVNVYAGISHGAKFFINPSYTYKTHFYFEDANTPGLDQPALGLLNMTLGIELADPAVVLSLFGTNILDKQFITSAGNTGSLFGVPTFTPGAPRMVGAKVTMKF
jgi:iron complex outermembrane recepter protein